jgi:membrane protease YdiL (CAAX protease family)
VRVLDVATTRKVLAAILIAGICGLLLFGVAAAWRYRRGLYPPLRRRLVSWDLADILICFVIVHLVPSVVFQVLKVSGFFQWWYGATPNLKDHILLVRCMNWASCLGLPFALLAVLSWLAMRGTRPWQIGLSPWRLGRSVAAAAVSGWMVIPAVFLIHQAAEWFDILVLKADPTKQDKHPLLELMTSQLASADWILVVLVALVKAPLEEELIFRGLLLPWLAERWWSAPIVWSVSLLVAAELGPGLAPVIFSGVVGLPLLLVCIRKDILPGPFLAVFGSSLLFAVAHSNVWPTPIPLFFLGFGLGYLMQRTRSLYAPITLHSLFNSVSTILILTGLAERMQKGF